MTRSSHGFTHDVATVGGAVIDEYAATDHITIRHLAHAAAERYACVPIDAKLALSSLFAGPGGGAVNTATTFASLKLSTAIVARVGKDIAGESILDYLRNKRIDIRATQRDPQAATGKSLILKTSTGERTIFVYRGANTKLDPVAITNGRLRPRWLYVTGLSGQLKDMMLLLDYAETIGARVHWNPGMEDLSLGLRRLLPILRRLDVLQLNRAEAAFLSHHAPRHLEPMFHALRDAPRTALLITDGQKGAYLATKDTLLFCAALPGKRVDSTGAGDAFGSGFIAGFIHTDNLKTALRIGMLNALGVIRRPGATNGQLTRWPAASALRKAVVTER